MLELERPSLEHAPRERNAQHFVEREVNHHCGNDRDQGGDAPASAECAHPHREDQHAGEMKAERIGEQDVGDEPCEDRGNRAACARPLHPLRHCKERRVLTQAGANEKRAADCKTHCDQPGKPRRTEFLARHGGKPLDMPEGERGECDQRRAGQRIVDFYLASPTALSAAPRFASDAAMNLAVSWGSAQTTPNPRLAMKSLYSFESKTFFRAVTRVRCASAGIPFGAAITRQAAICQLVPSSCLSVGRPG